MTCLDEKTPRQEGTEASRTPSNGGSSTVNITTIGQPHDGPCYPLPCAHAALVNADDMDDAEREDRDLRRIVCYGQPYVRFMENPRGVLFEDKTGGWIVHDVGKVAPVEALLRRVYDRIRDLDESAHA